MKRPKIEVLRAHILKTVDGEPTVVEEGYRFRYVAANGRVIVWSENYSDMRNLTRAIELTWGETVWRNGTEWIDGERGWFVEPLGAHPIRIVVPAGVKLARRSR